MTFKTNDLKPTHFEEDGTYWLVNNGIWYYWRELWGWCGYIGQVNTAFLASKQQLMHEIKK
ncbi:hypothetical protein I2F27_06655 [Acinetobacter sp. B5B]|uniref:hypothetical protein n=1 Tax=Acinetobacter TaxID=469 RepID=UPI0018A272A2|nr:MULTISPECIES: hypothetical protein [Acinetobacter]MBF7683005.1 hypothetical protein [Acinetobacter baretiae]MBF7696173.1 hypothetical protein [Acinetobacter rathckeae]